MELLVARRLPNLWALIEEGSFETLGVSGHATDTKSGWTQILTGYDPKVTGVYSNGRYRPIPEGLTLFERAQQAFGKENLFTIMVTGKAAHVGSICAGMPIGTGRKTELYGQPYCNTRRALDVWDGDRQRNAPLVGDAALAALQSAGNKRFAAFVHFSDPDHAGHASGENSAEYENAIVLCDEWLGRLTQWLKHRNLYESTRVYVTTDHGFNEDAKGHSFAPRSWLATNDNAIIKGGHQHDLALTMLLRMGIDLAGMKPAYPGRSMVISAPYRK
jgi:hypothetical protein